LQIQGLDKDTDSVVEPAKNLLVLAGENLKQVQENLKIPLADSKNTIDEVESINNITAYSLNNFEKSVSLLQYLH